MAKRYYERRALATALDTQLQGLGYNITEVREGYDNVTELEPPIVVVTFQPSKMDTQEMGRGDATPLFRRLVQIDCFMENEPRADSITDDIGDFIDAAFISVVDQEDTQIARMRSITDSIELETVSPNLSDPLWKHWRGIIRVTYEVQYI